MPKPKSPLIYKIEMRPVQRNSQAPFRVAQLRSGNVQSITVYVKKKIQNHALFLGPIIAPKMAKNPIFHRLQPHKLQRDRYRPL